MVKTAAPARMITYLAEHLFWHLGSMGGSPDESRLAVGNKEDKKSRLMSFDNKKWRDFLVKIRKVQDQLKDEISH